MKGAALLFSDVAKPVMQQALNLIVVLMFLDIVAVEQRDDTLVLHKMTLNIECSAMPNMLHCLFICVRGFTGSGWQWRINLRLTIF